MNVLALNVGSSSVKASLFDLRALPAVGDAPVGRRWERTIAAEGGAAPLDHVLSELGSDGVDVVGHRIVHGGALRESARVTPAVREAIAVAGHEAEHNAAALATIDATSALLGAHCPQVAVFDTSFHRTLPPAAYTYAGPYAWAEAGIRRYGFHGLSHEYASRRAARWMGLAPEALRVVTCHLGSGCSLAAVCEGRSVDTTMGFTPLDGVPMRRRSGAIDPGVLLHLVRERGYTLERLDHALSHDSGLAGLSGTSGDMREILAAVNAGEPRARLALAVFVHRVRQGIASMAASMGGLDALVFTGGVGEHAARVRADVCAPLGFLGVALDGATNDALAGEGDVTAAGTRVRTFVVAAQENWMIARECVRLVGA